MKMFNICLCMSCLFCFCWKQARYFSVFSWLVTLKKNKKKKQSDTSMFFFPLLLSPLLHHTIPAGANLRLTVYRCITRLHLSNLRPRLPPSPREGAADQEKGRNGWRSEGAKERSVSVSQRIGLCLSKSGSENVTAGEAEQRHLFSVCVCVCVCVCVFVWTLLSWGVIYAKITVSS